MAVVLDRMTHFSLAKWIHIFLQKRIAKFVTEELRDIHDFESALWNMSLLAVAETFLIVKLFVSEVKRNARYSIVGQFRRKRACRSIAMPG